MKTMGGKITKDDRKQFEDMAVVRWKAATTAVAQDSARMDSART